MNDTMTINIAYTSQLCSGSIEAVDAALGTSKLSARFSGFVQSGHDSARCWCGWVGPARSRHSEVRASYYVEQPRHPTVAAQRIRVQCQR